MKDISLNFFTKFKGSYNSKFRNEFRYFLQNLMFTLLQKQIDHKMCWSWLKSFAMYMINDPDPKKPETHLKKLLDILIQNGFLYFGKLRYLDTYRQLIN